MEAKGRNCMVVCQVIDNHFVDTPQEQLRWSTVSLSEVINKNYRLEANVFNIEGKHAREVLNYCKWNLRPLCGENGFVESYYPTRFKRILVNKSEFPIFQPSQVNEVDPKPNIYISELTKTDIDKIRVKRGQLLLTRSGTIGNVTFVSKTLDNSIFSDDLIRITPKNELDAGFLYAFLKTDIGNKIINTNNYGAVIKHIEPDHLKEVPVPDPAQEIKTQINQLIMDSFDLRDQSNELINEAQILLKSELELPTIEELKQEFFKNDVEIRNYQVKLSELNNRFDSSYHVPIVNSILDHVKKYAEEVTTLGNEKVSREIILPGRFKRVYVEEGQGVVFFGGKQLYELDPSNKKYLSLTHHGKRIKEQLTLKEKMILITCSGTIGKVNIVPSHWEGWTANQHILRIIPANENIAGYIYTWLSSEYGYELITRFTYGAVVDEIDDKQLAQVQIPLLKNKNIQKKINDLVLEANQKRYEAYVLEQDALQLMNSLVYQAK